jgi:hypothetical protein
MTRAGILDHHAALPEITTAIAELQPVDDGIAEALIFRGQNEFSKMRKRSRQAHIAETHRSNWGRRAISRIVRAMIRRRETITAWQLETGFAWNDIAAGVAESSPHLRPAHHNSTAPAFRFQPGIRREAGLEAVRTL